MPFSPITRREWQRVFLFICIVLILTSLPYVIGWLTQGSNWSFSGFLFGAEDGYSYLGKMRLGARGLLDFYLFYTPEPHSGAPLIFLPYLLPGWLAGLLVSDNNTALVGVMTLFFHLMRLVFSVLYIAVLYRFIAVFIRSPRTRFTALLLATLAGGLGWLLALVGLGQWLGSAPPDFFIPEGFSFLIVWGLPHLALARAALLGGLMLVMRGQQSAVNSPQNKQTWVRNAVGAGLLWLVVGLAVPFYLVIIYCILGAWGLAEWALTRRFPRALAQVCVLAAAITLPLFAYYTVTFSSNPAFAQWSAQNLLYSPHPLQYLLAYILLLIPAFVGARFLLKQAGARHALPLQNPADSLLIGWPLIVPLLVYLPINVQRRMAEAVIVPLAILAAVGLRFIAQRWGKWPGRVLVGASMMTAAFLLFGSTLAVLTPAQPLFQPNDELRALDWLNNHAPADAVVLAAFETGNVLPAYTNLRPYVGHGPETMFALDKTAVTEQFFGEGMPADERHALYEAFNIQYIWYGPLEKELSAPFGHRSDWQQDATLIYDEIDYQIYEIGS